jgi:hypothetical protein
MNWRDTFDKVVWLSVWAEEVQRDGKGDYVCVLSNGIDDVYILKTELICVKV